MLFNANNDGDDDDDIRDDDDDDDDDIYQINHNDETKPPITPSSRIYDRMDTKLSRIRVDPETTNHAQLPVSCSDPECWTGSRRLVVECSDGLPSSQVVIPAPDLRSCRWWSLDLSYLVGEFCPLISHCSCDIYLQVVVPTT